MAFYFQDDFWETVKELPRSQREKAIASLVEYYFTGEEPKLTGPAVMPFRAFKGRIDMSKKQSENASKPRRSSSNQTSPKAEPNANQTLTKDYPNQNQNVQPSEESKRESKSKSKKEEREKKFTPPSAYEVEQYSQELGHPIHGQSFVDFYASKGWMVGRNHMKDWKAAVRTWINRETKGGSASAETSTVLDGLPF